MRIMNALPALLGLLLLTGCAGLATREEPPRVNLVNLRIIDIQLFEQRYGLTLRIQNPDRNPLQIEGLSFKVELNGNAFAHGVSNQKVEVPAFGEAVMDLEMVSTLFNVVTQLRHLERQQGEPLSYRISGRLSLADSLLSIPFEQQGELGGTPSVVQSSAGPSTKPTVSKPCASRASSMSCQS